LRRSLPATDPSFRDRLESLYTTFDHADSATDPVHIVRRYRSREDREIVGFCAAALAFGRVASVLQSIEALLEVMGPHPAEFVREFEPIRHSTRIEPLVHRWIRGRDLVALLLILQRMLREATSIEAFFVAGDDPSSPDIAAALDEFARRAIDMDLSEAYGRVPKRPGVCYFFPRPSAGSACKRLNLFSALDDPEGRDRPRRLVAGIAIASDRAARHARDPARSLPPFDPLHQPGLEDGRGDHGIASGDQSRRSRAIRLFTVPRRDDECVRIRAFRSETRTVLSAAVVTPACGDARKPPPFLRPSARP
jgi:uncharacterized protein (TIGR02757 family)